MPSSTGETKTIQHYSEVVRPLAKGYRELIFKDAAERTRRTSQDFQSQIV